MSELVTTSVKQVSDELVIHDVVRHTLRSVIVADGSVLPKFVPATVTEAPPVYGPFADPIIANDVTGPAARRASPSTGSTDPPHARTHAHALAQARLPRTVEAELPGVRPH
jgi:hypothetical protein